MPGLFILVGRGINQNHTPVVVIEVSATLYRAGDPGSDEIDSSRHVVLPHAHDGPSLLLKGERLLTIPVDVQAKLFGPEFGSRTRPTVVLRAAMPEATINEDGNLGSDEHQVRSPNWSACMDAIAETGSPKHRAEPTLR